MKCAEQPDKEWGRWFDIVRQSLEDVFFSFDVLLLLLPENKALLAHFDCKDEKFTLNERNDIKITSNSAQLYLLANSFPDGISFAR